MSGTTSKCNKPPTIGEVQDKLPETLDAMGFNAECKKRATSAFASGATSANLDTPFGSAGGQASFTAGANDMEESGCGQFLANLNDTSTNLSNINCTIQDNQSKASITQSGTATILLETQAPTPEQLAILDKVREGQAKNLALAKANYQAYIISPGFSKTNAPFFQKLISDSDASLQETLGKISPSINIKNSKILNVTDMTLKSEVEMSSTQVAAISENIKAVAKQAAEQKMKQTLGVNALTPNAKQLIKNKIENNTLLQKDSIQSTVKSVSLEQTSDNTIKIINKGGGDLNIENSTISNNLVMDLANKAIMSNGNSAASQVVTEIINDQTSKQISEGKSAGQDDLARELGEANAKAIDSGKVKMSMGAVIALGLVVLLVLGGGGLIIKNVKGTFTKYIFLIVALIGIFVGVVGKGKDPDNVLMIVIGSILLVSGSGLGIYSLVKKKKKLPGGLRRYYY